jgi:hypothetical protein
MKCHDFSSTEVKGKHMRRTSWEHLLGVCKECKGVAKHTRNAFAKASAGFATVPTRTNPFPASPGIQLINFFSRANDVDSHTLS